VPWRLRRIILPSRVHLLQTTTRISGDSTRRGLPPAALDYLLRASAPYAQVAQSVDQRTENAGNSCRKPRIVTVFSGPFSSHPKYPRTRTGLVPLSGSGPTSWLSFLRCDVFDLYTYFFYTPSLSSKAKVLRRSVEPTAGDCLLVQSIEGLLWGKVALERDESAAIADPNRPVNI